MEIIIRRATENDAKKIFEWRNDLDSIAMSLSSKIIDWKTHEKWYNAAQGKKRKGKKPGKRQRLSNGNEADVKES